MFIVKTSGERSGQLGHVDTAGVRTERGGVDGIWFRRPLIVFSQS